jgi:hypothetical protein
MTFNGGGNVESKLKKNRKSTGARMVLFLIHYPLAAATLKRLRGRPARPVRSALF